MSWANNWQMQAGYGGYSTAVPPPVAAAPVGAPPGYAAMTPDQYAQWQQWQQYQQQYAQWHAQYGEQWVRQSGKPLPAPVAMPAMTIPTNVPPPAIVPAPQPQPVIPPIAAVAVMPPIAAVPPIPITAAPPPPAEPHPDTVAAVQAPAPPPPAAEDEEQVQKTPDEIAFDEQFRKWEEEFENWKRKNANHPDKAAYREYEKKFEECRKKLLERREHLRKKRLAEAAANGRSTTAPAAAPGVSVPPPGFHQAPTNFNQPPPPPPPEEKSNQEVGLFKNALGGGGILGGGIPGLDLIASEQTAASKIVGDEDVMEVIDLDNDTEEKTNTSQTDNGSGQKPPAQPVNALASLLKDPKVSQLLTIISGNNNGQGVNLASIGNSELLQQIQNAAGAVVNVNQNGSSQQGPGVPSQDFATIGGLTPLSDDRSTPSLHPDGQRSGDEQQPPADFVDFKRAPPPVMPGLGEGFNCIPQGPPPLMGFNEGFNSVPQGPPPLMGMNLNDSFNRAPPGGPGSNNFNMGPRDSNWDSNNQRFDRNNRGDFNQGPNRGDQRRGGPFNEDNNRRQDKFNRDQNQNRRQDNNFNRDQKSNRRQDNYGRDQARSQDRYDRDRTPNRRQDNFNRDQNRRSNDFSRQSPVNRRDDFRGSGSFDRDSNAKRPNDKFGYEPQTADRGLNFDATVPPPMLGVDLSRPPPMFGSDPVARPLRSDQPSPALSNTSSTNRQRQSRWGNNQDIKQEPDERQFDPCGEPPVAASIKNEPFNGGLDDSNSDYKLYEGHQDELEIDPELGTPCAVPKPEWMTEDEYEEIFDRYENVEEFEERKGKMQLAIKMLEQKKRNEGLLGGPPREQPPPAVVSANSNEGSGRWLSGGMPKPLVKEEPPFGGAPKRTNPFAAEDDFFRSKQPYGPADDGDFFRPKQVIDYSSGAPRVIEYGHGSGPVEPKMDGPNRERADRFMPGDDGWPPQNQHHSQQPQFDNGGGGRGRFEDEFQPQRFDYHHSQSLESDLPPIGDGPPPFIDRPSHYSDSSIQRLATMHENPHPDESNPCYPSKFILMNDNRPNRPSTKRGKRPSSIRKQKLRQKYSDEPKVDAESPQPNESADTVQEEEDQPKDATSTALERPSSYELEMKRGSPESQDPKSAFYLPPVTIVHIDDLLLPPGRFKRPPRICFIFRGIPGSGKSYLARMMKDCEVKNGGQAPRVLSIDDYFLVVREEREPDPKTGRIVTVTKSDYHFDPDMEDVYMQNLVKAFKRTITERLYNFVIVDCVNERLEYYNEFHNFARSNGFKVFTCTMQTELELCIEQNIHKRSLEDIKAYAKNWALSPQEHAQLNVGSLLDPQDSGEVQAADMELCSDDEEQVAKDFDDLEEAPQEENTEPQDIDEDSNVDVPELGFFASKWDTDTTEQNLARLDGISKPPRRPPTIEDFLQLEGDELDDYDDDRRGTGASSGKKRVRWADIEERKAQRKMREMGFVVGVTDWSRMMDPTQGGSALTRTKYIERVRRN